MLTILRTTRCAPFRAGRIRLDVRQAQRAACALNTYSSLQTGSPTSTTLLRTYSSLPIKSIGRHCTALQARPHPQLSLIRLATSVSRPIIDSSLPLEPYSPPTTGIISYLPSSWVPYAELIRLEKPWGFIYLTWPCLWSTFLAASTTAPMVSLPHTLYTASLFITGAWIMRSAGCAINDLWDRNLDPHVRRTRLRPLARRAITPQQAIVFTGFLHLAGLAVLLQFPPACLWYGIPSLLLVTAYPLAKRVTNYPQFVLGLTFSWGALMGFPALGTDLLTSTPALLAAAGLYTANVFWTVFYDIIYAHMDVKDDKKAGIKSIVVAHESYTKPIMSVLAGLQIACLAGAGLAVGASPLFYIGSCGLTSIALVQAVRKVKLDDPKDCWRWFQKGCWTVGGAVTIGVAAEYLAKSCDLYPEDAALIEEID